MLSVVPFMSYARMPVCLPLTGLPCSFSGRNCGTVGQNGFGMVFCPFFFPSDVLTFSNFTVLILLHAGYSQEDDGWSSFVSMKINITYWFNSTLTQLFCNLYHFLNYLLQTVWMDWSVAWGVRIRKKRSMNDWSSCLQISLRKGLLHSHTWQSFTTADLYHWFKYKLTNYDQLKFIFLFQA